MQIAGARKAVAPVPVPVLHRTVTQVRDARAAQLAEAGERDRIGAGAEQHVDAVPAAFQRRALVRRAEKDERAQPALPRVPGACPPTHMRCESPARPCCGLRAPARAAARATPRSASRAGLRSRRRWSRCGARCCSGGRACRPAGPAQGFARDRARCDSRCRRSGTGRGPSRSRAARGCRRSFASFPRSSGTGTPRRRKCIGIASGLPLASRRSPSTPLSAPTTASRPGRSEAPESSGTRGASTASTVPPTRRVTPRTLR